MRNFLFSLLRSPQSPTSFTILNFMLRIVGGRRTRNGTNGANGPDHPIVRQHFSPPHSLFSAAAAAASKTGNKINFPQTNEFRSLNLAPVNPPEWKFEAISNSSSRRKKRRPRPPLSPICGCRNTYRIFRRAPKSHSERPRPGAGAGGRACEGGLAFRRRSYIRHWI